MAVAFELWLELPNMYKNTTDVVLGQPLDAHIPLAMQALLA